jgi:two-component system, LytTR family, sensor kinase
LLCGFAASMGLLEFGYHYLDQVARAHDVNFRIPLIEELTASYAALVLLLGAVRMARHFRLDTGRWLLNLPIHVLALALGSVAHTSLNWGLRALLFPLFGLGPYDYGIMPTRYFMEFPSDTLLYATTVALTILYDRHVRARQLEKSLAEAQLHNLRLQLQPHFLFNTLNTISSVMYEDVRVADRMITRLSDLLRLSLEQSSAQEVTLDREIEFLNLYVETMKARFEERLSVRVEAGADVRNALVPPLLLQPLVENSIRHGADPTSSKVDVQVCAWRENGTLRLEVRDHGPGLAGTQAAALRNGIGLSNTAERLDRLYGGTQPIALENAPGGGLVVTLKVPFHVDPRATGR